MSKKPKIRNQKEFPDFDDVNYLIFNSFPDLSRTDAKNLYYFFVTLLVEIGIPYYKRQFENFIRLYKDSGRDFERAKKLFISDLLSA